MKKLLEWGLITSLLGLLAYAAVAPAQARDNAQEEQFTQLTNQVEYLEGQVNQLEAEKEHLQGLLDAAKALIAAANGVSSEGSILDSATPVGYSGNLTTGGETEYYFTNGGDEIYTTKEVDNLAGLKFEAKKIGQWAGHYRYLDGYTDGVNAVKAELE